MCVRVCVFLYMPHAPKGLACFSSACCVSPQRQSEAASTNDFTKELKKKKKSERRLKQSRNENPRKGHENIIVRGKTQSHRGEASQEDWLLKRPCGRVEECAVKNKIQDKTVPHGCWQEVALGLCLSSRLGSANCSLPAAQTQTRQMPQG